MLHKLLFKKYFISSVLFLIGTVIGFSLLLYLSTIFKIQHIEVIGGTQDERKKIILLFKDTSILTIQSQEIKNIVQKRFATLHVKDSRIQLPNTLFLVVETETPFAYLKTNNGYIALSKKGVVVMKERSLNIPSPAITFYQTIQHYEYQTGQHIGYTAIEKALIFIALLADEGYQTETVAIDSVDMIACKTKGFEVAFSQSRPVELQSNEVRQVIHQIKAGALRIGRLDLRFDKPVVQLPKK